MLSILGGLNTTTDLTLTLCTKRARGSLIIGRALGAERSAGIRQICGKRRFTRNTTKNLDRSILGSYQRVLGQRMLAFRTSSKSLQPP